MKRLFAFALSVLFLSLSVFGVTAFADEDDFVIFSEDLQTMTYDGDRYVRFDASCIEAGIYESPGKLKVIYEGNSGVSRSSFITNDEENVWKVEHTYKDGSVLTAYYIEEKAYEAYTKLAESTTDYEINFGYPTGNVVTADESLLKGKKSTFDDAYRNHEYLYYVSKTNQRFEFGCSKGLLLYSSRGCYYIGYDENPGFELYGEIKDKNSVIVWEITDEALIKKLNAAQEKYYGGIGIFEDDDFASGFSSVTLNLVFGIVPLLLFLFALTKVIRKTGVTRKIYAVLCAVCGAELLVYALLLIRLL